MPAIDWGYLGRPNTPEHQREFQRDLISKFLHLNGGYGSGKTYSLIMKSFQLSYLNRPWPGGMLVPTIAEYKKDVLPAMEDILASKNLLHRTQYNKTDKTWRFPWSRGKLYIVSGENQLRGPNWAYGLVNEVTRIDWQRYKEVVGRVRIKAAPFPQIASSGTPEGIAHELYENFVLNPMARSRIIYGDTRANAMNLGDDYIQSLLDSYDEISLSAYLRGLFVNMNGNQFYYALDPNKNYDRSIRRVEGATVLISLDFNVDPYCATLWNKVWNHDTLQDEYHAFQEITLHGKQTKDMVTAWRARGCVPGSTIIYPDPHGTARSTAGNPDIVTIGKLGFTQIKYRSTAPQFRQRQLAVNNLLDKGRIKLNPDACPSLKRDLEAVSQDTADWSKVKDNKKLTHSSDGLDYMIDIEEPLSGTKPEIRTTRIR